MADLAQQVVEFVAKGLGSVQDAFTKIKQDLDKTETGIQAMQTAMQSAGSGPAAAASAYGKLVDQAHKVTEEMQRLKKAADWDLLVKQKGKIGAWASYYRQEIASVAGQLRSALGRAVTQTTANIAATPAAIGLAVAGFNLLVSSARSWVSAGIAGTVYGNQLQLQFTQLSQQIAGIFVPTLRAVTEGVRQVVTWFRQLSGDQQATIRHWIEAAAVMLAAHKVLGLLKGMFGQVATAAMGALASIGTSIVSTLIPAFGSLVTAVVTGSGVMSAALGLATAGISVLLGAIAAALSVAVSLGIAAAGAATTAGAGIVAGTESGRSALRELIGAFRPLLDVLRQLYTVAANTLGPVLEAIGAELGGALREVATAAGGQLLEALTAMLPTITAIVEWVGRAAIWLVQASMAAARWFNETVGFRTLLGTIVGVFVAIAGVIAALTAIVAGALVPLIASIAVILAPVIGGVTAIGAAFVAVGYVLYRVFAAIWEPLQRIFASVWQVATILWRLATAVGSALVSVFGEIVSALSQMLGLGSGFGGVLDTIRGIAEAVSSTLQAVVEWLRANLPPIVEQVATRIARMIQQVSTAISTIAESGLPGADRLRSITQTLDRMAIAIGRVRLDLSETPLGRPANGPGQPRNDVAPAGGQFEDAAALFRRMTEASLKSADEERRRRDSDNLARSAAANERTAEALARPQPRPLIGPTPAATLLRGGTGNVSFTPAGGQG